MNVQVQSKDVTLHANTKAHIQNAIDNFAKYSLDITTVNVRIKAEKKGVSIEFDIHIAHAEPVVISQTDDNLDTAIDLGIERATKALRRLHDKIVAPAKGSIKDLETLDS
ncbi:MAG: ribosome-associated translation inhibitor RaiA [Thiovulaceae bacterium]|nr:ribosome-associated translation inhibitor RaiA [Sulfurimonadaceae bacterium]MCW9025964.1 ribosome-associated translation inhibitor RaiA [Sulfurimonadaceae bacterium]